MLSSFSDNNNYPEFCLKASKNDDLFGSFRRKPIYNQIVELLSEEQGQAFLNEIELNSDSLGEINNFKNNDLYGNPRKFHYLKIGELSPTTLMYIKVIYDLDFAI